MAVGCRVMAMEISLGDTSTSSPCLRATSPTLSLMRANSATRRSSSARYPPSPIASSVTSRSVRDEDDALPG